MCAVGDAGACPMGVVLSMALHGKFTGVVACVNSSFEDNMEHWIIEPRFLIPAGWRGPWVGTVPD